MGSRQQKAAKCLGAIALSDRYENDWVKPNISSIIYLMSNFVIFSVFPDFIKFHICYLAKL
jgi:hypothetical protein